jgi:hypothetical protein
MKLKTAQRLREFWDDIQFEEPDISTERLMAMTADRHNIIYGTEFDNGDVAEALVLTGDLAAGPLTDGEGKRV